ncbi:MFS transporter [Nonomuraea sp. NPDC049400]|uniref:MFS transporter n=1 Tax=Nonomuraea sp. NPDC049400 TaxID=3364352 RepID=UPI00378D4A6F
MTDTHQEPGHRFITSSHSRTVARVVKPARHRAHARTRTGTMGMLACAAGALATADASAAPPLLAAVAVDPIGAGIAPSELIRISMLSLMASLALLGVAGRMLQVLGHRRMLAGGVALFGIGAAATATAPTWVLLLTGRLLQGTGAAFLLPAALAFVLNELPTPRRAQALAWWIAGCGLAAVLALAAAGVLVSGPGWRAVYALGSGAALILLVVLVVLHRGAHPAVRRSDLAGALMLAGAMVAAVVASTGGGSRGWTSLHTLGWSAAALALAAASLLVRARTKRLDEPARAGSMVGVGSGGLWACGYGVLWLLMLGQRAPAPQLHGVGAGWLVPLWLGVVVAAPAAAVLGRRHGPTAVLYNSAISTAAGCLLLLIAQENLSGWGALAVGLIGTGVGALVSATFLTALGARAPEHSASAVAALPGARLLGAMLVVSSSSAVLGHPLLEERLTGYASVLIGGLGVAALAATAILIHALLHMRRCVAAPVAVPVLVVPPVTAEDQAAVLRSLLVEVRGEVAQLHDDVSVALARLEATAQRGTDVDQLAAHPRLDDDGSPRARERSW